MKFPFQHKPRILFQERPGISFQAQSAFTLVELIIVIVIIAILATVLLFLSQSYTARARLDVGTHTVVAALSDFRTSIQSGFRSVDALGRTKARCIGLKLEEKGLTPVAVPLENDEEKPCKAQNLDTNVSLTTPPLHEHLILKDFSFQDVSYESLLVLFAPPHAKVFVFGLKGGSYAELKQGNKPVSFAVSYGSAGTLFKEISIEPLTGRIYIK